METRHDRLKRLAAMAMEIVRKTSDEEIAGLANLIADLAEELDQSTSEE